MSQKKASKSASAPSRAADRPMPWIRIGDFRETSYWISVENATTGTKVKSDDALEVVEFLENGIVLKMPARVCSLGHLISIRIAQHSVALVPKNAPPEVIFEMECTAKVTSVEDFDGKHRVVSATFYQYDEQRWNKLMHDYAKRQEEIRDLIRSRKA